MNGYAKKIGRFCADMNVGRVCLFAMVFVMPLIVKWMPSNLTQLEEQTYGFRTYGDIFAHGKSELFTVLGIIGFIGLVVSKIRSGPLRISKVMLLPMLLGMLVFLSGLFSPYFPIPLTGTPERYESMWVQLSYLVLFGLATRYLAEEKAASTMEAVISIQMMVLGMICIGQYYGANPLNWELLRVLIAGRELAEQYPVIALNSERIYGTLGNPGNLAQYCSFAVPLLLYGAHLKGRPLFRHYAVIALGWFMVLGTGSGAAILGVCTGILLGLWMIIQSELRINRLLLWVPLAAGCIMAFPHIGAVMNGENIVLLAAFCTIIGIASYSIKVQEILRVKRVLVLGCMGAAILVCTIILYSPIGGTEGFITDLEVEEGHIAITTLEGSHEVYAKNKTVSFYTTEGKLIPTRVENGIFKTSVTSVDGLDYGIENSGESVQLVMYRTGMRFEISGNRLMTLNRDGRPVSLVRPKAMGFKGKEAIFSCRGYIWSRSLPLLFQRPLLGTGSDSFVFTFPQTDYGGKFDVFGTPYMLIDKPHSFYLQYVIQQGIPAFLILVIMVGVAFQRGIAEYGLRRNQTLVLPYIAGLTGFLAAGLFNDSHISTTLFFWVALGVLSKETRSPAQE